jgi:DNA (cytosine-5)-methyltransferase 1
MSTDMSMSTSTDDRPTRRDVDVDVTTSCTSSTLSCSQEDVLLIPQRLTKTAYNLLIECDAGLRPWHLEGRFGSRTHRVREGIMGLPVGSRERVYQQAELHPKLRELLDTEGVSIVNKPFVPSNRAFEPQEVDARLHPERERKGHVAAKKPFKSSSGLALFTYIELFAGIGGFGVAADALGGKCVFCSELEQHCRDTYQANFDTDTTNVHGDIYQVKDDEFPKSVDLLVAGFPCQPFSALGDQPGLNCEKGRGHLFMQIVRVLNISRPKGFLLENVPGLIGMTETFQTILETFQAAGYTVTTQVCSARGITATNRKRLFFVGFRDDLPTADKFEFPYVPDLKLRAKHVLDYDDLPDEELQILRLADTTMQQLVTGGRWRPASLAWPNLVPNTITSHYGNAVGRGESQLVPGMAHHHPRRFSIRECARIMGFPNTYTFLPPRSNQGAMAYRKEYYRMVGNAVCPPLIAALAGAVLAHCELGIDVDFVQHGLDTAITLAMAATRRSTPARLPQGCLVPTETERTKKRSANRDDQDITAQPAKK